MRVQGLGFRVVVGFQGSGLWILGLQGLGFRARGLGFVRSGLETCFKGFGLGLMGQVMLFG